MAPKPKPASSPSQPQPQPPLEDLFVTLNRHIHSSAFDNAVRVADQILAIAPGDDEALRCKVVAMIKDDRIDGALSAVQSSRRRPDDFDFLKFDETNGGIFLVARKMEFVDTRWKRQEAC